MTDMGTRYRLRIVFGKNDRLRFVGHLDLAKTWERVFRRAKMPLIYSQGFNPQPKIQFAAALPLGISSECELLDAWLSEAISPDALVDRLNIVSPPGLTVLRAVEVPLKESALQTQTVSAEYGITVDEVDDAELRRRISNLLAQEKIERERRRKTYDLRPLILNLEAEGDNHFLARLALGERGTGRPDELLAAMEFSPNFARCHRLAIHLRE